MCLLELVLLFYYCACLICLSVDCVGVCLLTVFCCCLMMVPGHSCLVWFWWFVLSAFVLGCYELFVWFVRMLTAS